MAKTTTKTTRKTPAKQAPKTAPKKADDPAKDDAIQSVAQQAKATEKVPTKSVGDDLHTSPESAAEYAAMVTVAKVVHAATRIWADEHGEPLTSAWDESPQWHQDSVCDGVLFHTDNPGATPADSHKNWMAEKLADGWVYGEVKDPDAKTHPCLVPFEDLPEQQQAKDRLFKAIVHALVPIEVPSETVDGAPTKVLYHDLLQLDDGWHYEPAMAIALKAYIAADACGQLLPRDVIASWPDGALNRLIAKGAEACRAFEGVNPEALYTVLQQELRDLVFWPGVEPDSDEAGLSHLREYADATPLQMAWVEVFASTLDHLDALHARFPALNADAQTDVA
jgi:hypothetical protein